MIFWVLYFQFSFSNIYEINQQSELIEIYENYGLLLINDTIKININSSIKLINTGEKSFNIKKNSVLIPYEDILHLKNNDIIELIIYKPSQKMSFIIVTNIKSCQIFKYKINYLTYDYIFNNKTSLDCLLIMNIFQEKNILSTNLQNIEILNEKNEKQKLNDEKLYFKTQSLLIKFPTLNIENNSFLSIKNDPYHEYTLTENIIFILLIVIIGPFLCLVYFFYFKYC